MAKATSEIAKAVAAILVSMPPILMIWTALKRAMLHKIEKKKLASSEWSICC
jgi:hypothetical protein